MAATDRGEATTPASGSRRLLAAVSTVDITPPVGYYLAGYAARKEPSNALRDPLHGRLLLLDNGVTRLAIVTLDLIGLRRPTVLRARQAIAEAAGVQPDHILLNWSHTHAGPEVERYETYVAQLADKLGGAALAASRQMQPASLAYAESTIDFNVNRRLPMPDGSVAMAPNPAGIVDRRLRLIRLDSNSARPMAVLFHAVCHANALRHDNLAISADFPGLAQDLVATAFGPGCTPMFIQGCTGNLRANLPGEGGFRSADPEDLRWCGFSLGGAAISAAARAGTREAARLGDELDAAEVLLSLPGRAGPAVEYPVQAMRLGNLLLIALAGEPVLEYGLALEAQCGGWLQVLVAGYSNASVGYLATPAIYAEGGYEGSPGASPFTPAAEAIVLQAGRDLAQRLAGGNLRPFSSTAATDAQNA